MHVLKKVYLRGLSSRERRVTLKEGAVCSVCCVSRVDEKGGVVINDNIPLLTAYGEGQGESVHCQPASGLYR